MAGAACAGVESRKMLAVTKLENIKV